MKSRFLAILMAGLLGAHLPAAAEDIDLFVSAPPSTAEVPNVLIILDNTANWGPAAKFAIEKSTLASVFNGLPTGRFRVGLMLANETGNPNNNVAGGYVRGAVRLMDAANKSTYATMINNFDITADRGNAGRVGSTMAEAYYYFAGLPPYAGNSKVKADYTGNTYTPTTPPVLAASMAFSRPVWALAGNALPSFAGSPYISPVVTGCAKNFIIFISNGDQGNNDAGPATTQLTTVGGNTVAIPISPSGSQANLADEWSRFMKQSTQAITTYTVDIDKVATGQGPGWTALLRSIAGVSGGRYFDVSSAAGAGSQISDALNVIFGEIQAVNSVFASVSLPASANTQSTFLNQVFVGMFRPDGDSLPRWPGNLKQYKLGLVGSSLRLLDANSNQAINSGTGFITECSRSYWTPATTDSYWANKPQGSCLAVAASDVSNYPDGPVVEKGAQGYQTRSALRTTTYPGKVFTCSPTFASCTTLTDFATSNAAITPALLGAADATEKDNIINWARGEDNLDEDIDAVTSAEMRQSGHGDVVHSRPVAINFGTVASPQVVVFYSGNDGMLRAINGNRSGGVNINGVVPGKELWTFAAPEAYTTFKRNRDNAIPISYPGTSAAVPSTTSVLIGVGAKTFTVATGLSYTVGATIRASFDPDNYMQGTVTSYVSLTGTLVLNITSTSGAGSYSPWSISRNLPKPYGIDGPITGFVGSIAGSPKTFIYTAMRRGGRALYAFDATNTLTGAPTLKWKVGCPSLLNDAGCTGPGYTPANQTAISSIGQTWSPATSMRADGYGSGLSPLLIMGGGYDNCEDRDAAGANHGCTGGSDKGNRIYVLDADTGALLRTLNTDRGVVGAITLVTNPATGIARYGYAAELGGNLYRISGVDANTPFAATAPGSWTITKIASLGCSTPAACTANRKFLFGPDVVEPATDTFVVLAGAGDREKPLLSYAAANGVTNYFFSVTDRPTVATWLSDESDGASGTVANPGGSCGSSVMCLDSLAAITSSATPSAATLNAKKGFALQLASTEQVVTAAITVADTVTFSSFLPAAPVAGTCGSNLGVANVYNINYGNAAASSGNRFQPVVGGGLPPSPVAGLVTLDNGQTVPFLIGGSPDSPLEGGSPSSGINWTQPKSRVYWHVDQ